MHVQANISQQQLIQLCNPHSLNLKQLKEQILQLLSVLSNQCIIAIERKQRLFVQLQRMNSIQFNQEELINLLKWQLTMDFMLKYNAWSKGSQINLSSSPVLIKIYEQILRPLHPSAKYQDRSEYLSTLPKQNAQNLLKGRSKKNLSRQKSQKKINQNPQLKRQLKYIYFNILCAALDMPIRKQTIQSSLVHQLTNIDQQNIKDKIFYFVDVGEMIQQRNGWRWFTQLFKNQANSNLNSTNLYNKLLFKLFYLGLTIQSLEFQAVQAAIKFISQLIIIQFNQIENNDKQPVITKKVSQPQRRNSARLTLNSANLYKKRQTLKKITHYSKILYFLNQNTIRNEQSSTKAKQKLQKRYSRQVQQGQKQQFQSIKNGQNFELLQQKMGNYLQQNITKFKELNEIYINISDQYDQLTKMLTSKKQNLLLESIYSKQIDKKDNIISYQQEQKRISMLFFANKLNIIFSSIEIPYHDAFKHCKSQFLKQSNIKKTRSQQQNKQYQHQKGEIMKQFQANLIKNEKQQWKQVKQRKLSPLLTKAQSLTKQKLKLPIPYKPNIQVQNRLRLKIIKRNVQQQKQPSNNQIKKQSSNHRNTQQTLNHQNKKQIKQSSKFKQNQIIYDLATFKTKKGSSFIINGRIDTLDQYMRIRNNIVNPNFYHQMLLCKRSLSTSNFNVAQHEKSKIHSLQSKFSKLPSKQKKSINIKIINQSVNKDNLSVKQATILNRSSQKTSMWMKNLSKSKQQFRRRKGSLILRNSNLVKLKSSSKKCVQKLQKNKNQRSHQQNQKSQQQNQKSQQQKQKRVGYKNDQKSRSGITQMLEKNIKTIVSVKKMNSNRRKLSLNLNIQANKNTQTANKKIQITYKNIQSTQKMILKTHRNIQTPDIGTQVLKSQIHESVQVSKQQSHHNTINKTTQSNDDNQIDKEKQIDFQDIEDANIAIQKYFKTFLTYKQYKKRMSQKYYFYQQLQKLKTNKQYLFSNKIFTIISKETIKSHHLSNRPQWNIYRLFIQYKFLIYLVQFNQELLFDSFHLQGLDYMESKFKIATESYNQFKQSNSQFYIIANLGEQINLYTIKLLTDYYQNKLNLIKTTSNATKLFKTQDQIFIRPFYMHNQDIIQFIGIQREKNYCQNLLVYATKSFNNNKNIRKAIQYALKTFFDPMNKFISQWSRHNDISYSTKQAQQNDIIKNNIKVQKKIYHSFFTTKSSKRNLQLSKATNLLDEINITTSNQQKEINYQLKKFCQNISILEKIKKVLIYNKKYLFFQIKTIRIQNLQGNKKYQYFLILEQLNFNLGSQKIIILVFPIQEKVKLSTKSKIYQQNKINQPNLINKYKVKNQQNFNKKQKINIQQKINIKQINIKSKASSNKQRLIQNINLISTNFTKCHSLNEVFSILTTKKLIKTKTWQNALFNKILFTQSQIKVIKKASVQKRPKQWSNNLQQIDQNYVQQIKTNKLFRNNIYFTIKLIIFDQNNLVIGIVQNPIKSYFFVLSFDQLNYIKPKIKCKTLSRAHLSITRRANETKQPRISLPLYMDTNFINLTVANILQSVQSIKIARKTNTSALLKSSKSLKRMIPIFMTKQQKVSQIKQKFIGILRYQSQLRLVQSEQYSSKQNIKQKYKKSNNSISQNINSQDHELQLLIQDQIIQLYPIKYYWPDINSSQNKSKKQIKNSYNFRLINDSLITINFNQNQHFIKKSNQVKSIYHTKHQHILSENKAKTKGIILNQIVRKYDKFTYYQAYKQYVHANQSLYFTFLIQINQIINFRLKFYPQNNYKTNNYTQKSKQTIQKTKQLIKQDYQKIQQSKQKMQQNKQKIKQNSQKIKQNNQKINWPSKTYQLQLIFMDGINPFQEHYKTKCIDTADKTILKKIYINLQNLSTFSIDNIVLTKKMMKSKRLRDRLHSLAYQQLQAILRKI